jgi:DNA repair exonuclease SbcCD ATPase subunit
MHVKSFKMAIPRSLFLVALLGLVCAFAAVVRADDGIPPSYEYGNEIVALKSKLSLLEEGLKHKELSLSEKESKISELEQELDALRTRKEETEDSKLAQLKIDSALSKVRELESQVQSLQEESDKLRVEADLHANRAKTVEETATGHLTEKEKATKALEDQKIRLQKAERGLQIAEAAMLKAKAEAEEKAKKLDDLHKAWLPPWASTHADTLTKTASGHWSTHADPVVKNLQRTASSKAADAHEYIKPHLETFHTKVNPLIKEKWQKLAAAAAPHLETVKKAGVSSREYIAPHVETVQKTVTPYVEVCIFFLSPSQLRFLEFCIF